MSFGVFSDQGDPTGSAVAASASEGAQAPSAIFRFFRRARCGTRDARRERHLVVDGCRRRSGGANVDLW